MSGPWIAFALSLILAVGCGGGGGGGGGGGDDGGGTGGGFAGEEVLYEATEEIVSGDATGWIDFEVPADAISFTVEGLTTNGTTEIGVDTLIGPSGREYVTDRNGPMRVRKGFEVVSVLDNDPAKIGSQTLARPVSGRLVAPCLRRDTS